MNEVYKEIEEVVEKCVDAIIAAGLTACQAQRVPFLLTEKIELGNKDVYTRVLFKRYENPYSDR